MKEKNQKKKKENLTQKFLELQIEVLDKIITLVTTGLGLVAALAWNSAIQEFFKTYFPQKQNTLWAMFLYAIFITIIVVILTVYLSKTARKLKENLKKIIEE